MDKEFVPYNESLELKALGFDEPTLYHWHKSSKENPFTNGPRTNSGIKDIGDENHVWSAPTFSQAINFLYICSNKQIDIELKASDTYEERVRKVAQGCEDLRNLQNNKSN